MRKGIERFQRDLEIRPYMADPLSIPGRVVPVIRHLESDTGFEIKKPLRGIADKYDTDVVRTVIEEIGRYPATPPDQPFFQGHTRGRNVKNAIPTRCKQMYSDDQIAGTGRLIPELQLELQRCPDIDEFLYTRIHGDQFHPFDPDIGIPRRLNGIRIDLPQILHLRAPQI